MALSATEIEASIKALQQALSTGALRVKFREREVEYRSIADIMSAIREMQRLLDEANGTKSLRQVRFNMTKGY
jgi:hypothetical protein